MVKLSKKGYMKTLEAMIAIVMTFVFLSFILPSGGVGVKSESKDFLSRLSNDDMFRLEALSLSNCVSTTDNITLSIIIDKEINGAYNYVLCPNNLKTVLPRKTVNAESIYLNPKYGSNDSVIIRLYYWQD